MCFAPQRRAIVHLSSAQLAPPAALASLLFDPPQPQIIGKTLCFANFLTFRAPGSSVFGDFLFLIFFLLLFSSLLLASLLFSSLLFSFWSSFFFSSLLFSDSSNLCFSSVHIVASLTSKLPSNIDIPYIYISSIAPSQRASPMPNLSRRAPESPPCEHCKA